MKNFRKIVMTIFILLVLTFSIHTTVLAKTHSGTITVSLDLSGYDAGKEVEVWIPYPISDKDQTITGVKISGDCAASAVYSDNVYSTPMLYAKWDKGASSRKLLFSFQAERQEVTRRDFPKQETVWDPADYAQYLSPTSRGPVDENVKRLADTITSGKKTVLEKAKAIYDWTCENTYRDPKTRGCGDGDVCKLLVKPGGKCADIHSVFVALARAAGVPAREVFGIRLGKKVTEDITGSQHCWAEFYLPGYDWVPVDAADVRKAMLAENLKPQDAKTSELRAYYWGGLDSYRIKLAVGRDLTLNPPQPGEPLNYFMYPFARVGERILDWLDPASFKYSISYSAK